MEDNDPPPSFVRHTRVDWRMRVRVSVSAHVREYVCVCVRASICMCVRVCVSLCFSLWVYAGGCARALVRAHIQI